MDEIVNFQTKELSLGHSLKSSLQTFFCYFQGRSNHRRHPQDVQILTLDDAETDKRQTFRREGSAEILELEHDQEGDLSEAVETAEASEAELNRLPRQRLEVLQEELEEDASSSPPKAHNSNFEGFQRSACTSPDVEAVEAATEDLRKISDHKEQQTDITYGHVNKKVQADTMNSEDQNSDIDSHDTDGEASSSVLSQSIR